MQPEITLINPGSRGQRLKGESRECSIIDENRAVIDGRIDGIHLLNPGTGIPTQFKIF